MSFSLSSTVITQSGTDTTCAGLAAISGVTRYSSNSKDVYVIVGRSINVGGTWTLNVDEQLIFVNSPPNEIYVFGTGHFIVDYRELAQDGSTRYNTSQAIIFQREGISTSVPNDACLRTEDTASLTIRGGTIHSGANIRLLSSVQPTFDSCRLLTTYIAAILNLQVGANIENSLVTEGFRFGTNAALTFNGTAIVNTGGLGGLYSNVVGLAFLFNDFAPRENGADIALRQNIKIDIVGCTTGMSAKIVGFTSGNGGALCRMFRNVRFRFNDPEGVGIPNVKMHVRNVNNGGRADRTSVYGSTNRGYTNNFIADQVVSETTDGTGVTPSNEILLKTWCQTGTDASTLDVERFTKGNLDTAEMDVRAIAYDRAIIDLPFFMNGTGTLEVVNTMIPDFVITESSKTIVDAYTGIDTAAQFYDRAKSYLYDNFAGQTETLVGRSGTLIDLGSYDLDIDATATSVFAVSGNKITIKSSVFVDDLTTTGVITLLNGASVSGTRTDANGTITPPVTLTLTGLRPNSEVRVFEAGTTTELAGVENSGTLFTYNYQYAGDVDVDISVLALGYQNLRLKNVTLTASNSSLPIQQIVDRQYSNPV